jgi:phage/plasmid-like protein (TIGR03299 family)
MAKAKKGATNMSNTMVQRMENRVNKGESWRNVTGIDSIYLAGESRNVPWADLGNNVEEAQTMQYALQLSGLDWVVEQSPVEYVVNGVHRKGKGLVNYRSDTGAEIGIVSPNYKPVNNIDAFNFTELLVDNGSAVYNAAGSFKGGAITFVSMELPCVEVMDELHDRFIVVVADHTGKHSVRIFPAIVRISCLNTLNLALRTAPRVISISHIGDIAAKMENAKTALFATEKYTAEYAKAAENMSLIKVSKSDAEALLTRLFPIPEDGVTKQRLDNIAQMREGFIAALNANDLGNFRGTALQYVQAASDFSYHRAPLRKNPKHNESIFSQLLSGSKILDTTYAWAQELVA